MRVIKKKNKVEEVEPGSVIHSVYQFLVCGFGLRIQGIGLRVQGVGLRVEYSWCRVEG